MHAKTRLKRHVFYFIFSLKGTLWKKTKRNKKENSYAAKKLTFKTFMQQKG